MVHPSESLLAFSLLSLRGVGDVASASTGYWLSLRGGRRMRLRQPIGHAAMHSEQVG